MGRELKKTFFRLSCGQIQTVLFADSAPVVVIPALVPALSGICPESFFYFVIPVFCHSSLSGIFFQKDCGQAAMTGLERE